MTTNDMLTLLKVDLGIINPTGDLATMLTHLIDRSILMIEREGVTFGDTYDVEDGALIVMYAAWSYRKRNTDEGMPRMLRWALNNKLFAQKGTVEEDDTDTEEEEDAT